MSQTIYTIEIRSLRQCVQHLRTLNLAELAIKAERHGTEADRAFIEAVRDVLPGIPTTHP